MKVIQKISSFINKYLIYIMLVIMVFSYTMPQTILVLPLDTNLLLGIVMLCMGLTLDVSNFKAVAKHPKAFILGIIVQYTVGPLSAYLIAKAFQLPDALVVGFILLGSTPGGTASNVMTFLANGDVALTVSLTSIATLMATFVTPALMLLLASQYTPIHFMEMLQSVLQVVFVPVVFGLVLHYVFVKYIEKLKPLFVTISSCSILLIVAKIVASKGSTIMQAGILVLAGVIIHNFVGYGAGYYIAKLLGCTRAQAISICFQTGMKNTTLAVNLSSEHLTTLPAAVAPAAVGLVIHQITGPILVKIINKGGNEK